METQSFTVLDRQGLIKVAEFLLQEVKSLTKENENFRKAQCDISEERLKAAEDQETITELRNEVARLNQQIEEERRLNNHQTELSERLEKAEYQLTVLRQECCVLKENVDLLEEIKTDFNQHATAYMSSYDKLKGHLTSLEIENQELKDTIKELNTRKDNEELVRNSKVAEKSLEIMAQKYSALRKKLEILEPENKELKKTVSENVDSGKRLMIYIMSLQDYVHELKEKTKTCNQQQQQNENELEIVNTGSIAVSPKKNSESGQHSKPRERRKGIF